MAPLASFYSPVARSVFSCPLHSSVFCITPEIVLGLSSV
jgi:hypothetical protein